MNLQQIIFALEQYWSERGCLIHQPWDGEVGAGTMNPATFLRVLGPEPWKVAYVEPSRRPTDGRYGENPNRLYKHPQYQVILKPAPADLQELYLELRALGIDPAAHDIRFVEDNWESPAIAAWGIGWQVCSTGRRSRSSPTSSRRAASTSTPSRSRSPTGSNASAMYLQDVDDVYKLRWSADVLYGEVRQRGGVPALALLVRGGRPRALPPALREVAGRGLADPEAARRPRTAWPPTTGRCARRSPSTCSTPGAPSR